MLKAVFFDAAGTLFDAREPVGHTYARIARLHGLHADDAAVSAGFRRAFASTPGLAFGPSRSAADLRRLEREWWHGLVHRSFAGLGEFDSFDAFFDKLFAYFADPTSWLPMPEVNATLQRLKDTNLKLGIISNFDHRLYRILDGLELRPFFDTITISSEAGYAKPARQIFAAALSSLNVNAAEAAHVGDSERMDVRGAQAAGLRAILIEVGKISGQISATAQSGIIRVSSLAQMIEVMRLLGLT
jgi:putative hydrolase of the HAD superfamily